MQHSDNAPVLFATHSTNSGHVIGEMTLNAPKSLNALSVDMCQLMSEQLTQWQNDDKVMAVLLRGSGDKAFCAGGDIRKLYDSMLDNPPLPNPYATDFFGSEYALYRQMHFYNKPIILWGNGIIMGGGMGLMAACSHRVVTETTKFAMPEISIGLFPDASGSWFLQRMPAHTGLFLGLTGALCNASDAQFASLAEYALPSDGYQNLIDALAQADWQNSSSKDADGLTSDARHITSQCLATLSQNTAVELKPSKLAQHWQTIKALMVSGGLQHIDALLHDDDAIAKLDSQFAEDKWTQRALATYRAGCPVTAALTYELYHKVKDLSLEQILYLEANVAVHCADNPDFREGVRALLIDKDKNPSWSRSLQDCLSDEGRAYIANHFNNPYPDGEHIFADWLGEQALGAQAVR
ncbi:enoyl-CoA hydratase/isomerase family protein [Psychrobacter sp. FDAARGOS_221]|uniref:enoyl-CoA hydratase/isomerase family protein n=1 Tax=Psychrobacter sp. FDAARGOS_221 TaxID=1975705 RepID=UPI000BB57BA0|nr:enoyl-CoA hydratase/isomerase family protein [Psychrobacter sp. FDAARGOS_221]PNK60452.1 enoyl-CoA hydratase/isomerase family protein [Psychrobacter sp. FDAARGOS_221]